MAAKKSSTNKKSPLGLQNCLVSYRPQAVTNLDTWVNDDAYPFNVSIESGYDKYQIYMVSARFILTAANINFDMKVTVKLVHGISRLKCGDYYILVPSTLHPKSDVYGK